MKIFENNKVYVQKYDMMYFLRFMIGEKIPEFVSNGFFILNQDEKYEFIEFIDPEAVDYFSNIDWIVDYSPYKDSSVEDIRAYVDELIDSRNKSVDEFNGKSDEYREKNYNSFGLSLNKMDYRIDTIRLIAFFKNGEIKFKLPKKENRENIIQKVISVFKGNKF